PPRLTQVFIEALDRAAWPSVDARPPTEPSPSRASRIVSAGGTISKHPLPVSQSLAKHAPRCITADVGRGRRERGRGETGPWVGTADVAVPCEEAAMGGLSSM